MDQPLDSLLDRLRRGGSGQDWERFVDLYGPLLKFWARRLVRADDVADLIQDLLLRVMQKLPSFRRVGNRTFLAWLRAVLRNRCRDLGRQAATRPCTRASTALDAAIGDDGRAEAALTDERNRLIRRALQIMRTDFQPTTWRACWERVAADRPAAEVAAELGVSVAVVYSATSRVLRHLRRELAGACD
jgi:RNA polymerase sigma-70 factor (ECF subfamily)